MPRPEVLFPDAVELTIGYLRDALDARDDDTPATKDVPDPRPSLFLTVQRLGGPRIDVVTDGPQLSFEAWGDDNAAAHDLAQLARALVLGMAGRTVNGTPVYRVDELAGVNELPDPVSHQPRYTFGVIVHVRGTALT